MKSLCFSPSRNSRRVLAGSIAAALLACAAPSEVRAGTLYWDTNDVAAGSGAATGTWGTDIFWTADSTGGVTTGAYLPGSDVIFAAGTNGTTGTVTVSGTQDANSITFDDNVAITISGGTGLTLGGAAGEGIFVAAGDNAANVSSTPITLNSGAAPLVRNAGTGLLTVGALTGAASGAQTITFSATSSGGITDASAISNGAGGTVAVTINSPGSGAVTLSGTNTFSGGLNLQAGTLKLGNAVANLGAATNQITFNGGTLLSGAGINSITQPIAIGANGGTISTVGAAGKLQFSGTLTGSGTLVRTGNAVAFNSTGTANDAQFSTGGTGFTGAVILNGGVVEVGAANALGNGTAATNTVTINTGAELAAGGSTPLVNKLIVNGGAILSGVGAATKDFSGSAATSGNFKVRMGDFYQAQNRNLTFSGPLSGNGVFTLISAATLNPSGQYLTFSGDNSAYSGRMTASAGYNLVFTQSSSLGSGGLTAVSNGAQLGGVGFAYDFGSTVPSFTNTRVGTSTGGVFGINTTLASTTTLDMATLGGGGMFLGSLVTSGTYSAPTLGADAGIFRLGGGGGTLTFTGNNALTGASSLVVNDPRVNGGGTVVLAAATNYTGSTQVNAGTLRLDFSAATAPTDNIISATSPLTMQGGNLALTGRAGGASSQAFASTAVTGASSATLTPSGSNALTLSHGAINRSAGAVFTENSITATAPYTTGGIALTTSNNNASGVLGTWAFAGTGANTRYATRNDTGVTGQILAASGAAAATAADLTDTTGLMNYDLTTATGTTPASVSANTIRYTGAAATTAPGATQFQVNGLLNAGTGIWTIGTSPITIGADKELVINAANNGFTISSIIGDNASGASAVTATGATAITLSGANTFTGGLNVTGGTVSFATNTNLGAAGKTITLNGGVLNSTPTTGNVTIDHPIVVGPNGGTLATAGTTTNGKITLGGGLLSGTGTFTHTGASDLQMQGANPNFSGTFNVSGMTEASAVNALGTGTINVNTGGELNIGISVQLTNRFVLNGGSLSGQNSVSGGTVTIPASATITAAGDFTLATRAFQDSTRVFSFTLAAPISGNGSLAGFTVGTNATNNRQVLLLSGNNSNWSGNISTVGGTASNGITLRLGSTTALGDSIGSTTIAPNSGLDLNGITLANAEPLFIGGAGSATFPTALTNEAATAATFSGPITLTGDTTIGSSTGAGFTLSGPIGGSFGLTKSFSATQGVTLSGTNTFTGNVSVAAGPLTITNSSALGAGSKTVSIIPSTNPTTIPGLFLDGSAGDITLPASMSFTTSFDALNNSVPIAGAGAVVNVAGNNTINGAFTLTSGGGGTTFLSNAGSLTIAGSLTPNTTGRIVFLRGNGNGVISGVIADGGTVGLPVTREVGTGTWTLSGNNTYTGATTVTSGTLLVTGSISGSTTTVSGAGIFGGTGTTGAVNVNSGGTLSPGVGIGTLNTTGNLALNSGSTLKLEISSTAGTSDRSAISGNLSLASDNSVVLSITDLAPAAIGSGTFTIATYSGTYSGGFFTVGGNIIDDYDAVLRPNSASFQVAGNTYRIDYNAGAGSNSVALIAVPEPGALMSMLGGLGMLTGFQRLRRRSSSR